MLPRSRLSSRTFVYAHTHTGTAPFFVSETVMAIIRALIQLPFFFVPYSLWVILYLYRC